MEKHSFAGKTKEEAIQKAKEELQEAHEILRVDFCKNGIESYEMRKISEELGHRGAQEWFAKHPRNTDPNFRWTDANRWDRD